MTILVLLMLVSCGCASVTLSNPRPWTIGEKVAAGTAVACIGADLGSTYVGREEYGLEELNPVARNYWALGLLKVAIAGIGWVIGESTGDRIRTWSMIAVMNCGIAGWNAYAIKSSR